MGGAGVHEQQQALAGDRANQAARAGLPGLQRANFSGARACAATRYGEDRHSLLQRGEFLTADWLQRSWR